MKQDNNPGISFFQRYLTIWVIICMVLGILIGKYLPGIPAFMNRFEYAWLSIPKAILIWLMIYPMMMKVVFQSIKNVGKNPKGLFVTWIRITEKAPNAAEAAAPQKSRLIHK